MNKKDYQSLSDSLLSDCRQAIAEFTTTADNRDVYAFVLDCDLHHGVVVIALNTEAGLKRTREASYPDYGDDQVEGLGGLRYSPADFQWHDKYEVSESTQRSLDKFAANLDGTATDKTRQRHRKLLEDLLVGTVEQLESDFRALERTDRFLAYVTEFDIDHARRIWWMRRTVSPALFDRIFPEVGEFERLLDGIDERRPEERARFWCNATVELWLERPSLVASQLAAMGRSRYDARRELQKVARAGVEQLLDVLDEMHDKPEFTEKGSEAAKKFGAFTPESTLYSSFVFLLRDAGVSDARVHERLHRLAERLFALVGPGDGLIGTNLQVTARVLHDLWPERWPEAEVGESNNRLLNFAEFGLAY